MMMNGISSDWLSCVEAAARGDMAGDPDATKKLDEMGPAAVILRLVGMVRWLAEGNDLPSFPVVLDGVQNTETD